MIAVISNDVMISHLLYGMVGCIKSVATFLTMSNKRTNKIKLQLRGNLCKLKCMMIKWRLYNGVKTTLN